jgi:hypothetical protein
MSVSADTEGDSLVVAVRDFGQGVRPLADLERRSLRLGLPLIAALTTGFEIEASASGGTTVRMRMPISSNGKQPERPERPPVADELRINIGTGHALAPVLSRVISMFATRANFSVDRLSDAVLISDAISAGARSSFTTGTARIIVTESGDAFEVRVGPLDSGGGRALIDGLRIPQLGGTLEALAEDVHVEEGDEGEFVLLRIGAMHGSPQGDAA